MNNKELTAFQTILIGIAVISVGYFLVNTFYQILLPFFLSLILAFLLNPLVNLISNKLHINRLLAITLLFVGFFLTLIFSIAIIIPNIIDEFGALQNKLPEYVEFFNQTFAKYENIFSKEFAFLSEQHFLDKVGTAIESFVMQLTNDIPNLIIEIFSVASIIIFVPFITFFYLLDGTKVKKAIYKFIPNKYFELYISLSFRINKQLTNYITGQFTDAFIIGVLSVIGLAILGVKYFWAIGIIAGLANLIPYVGPAAGAIPAIAVTIFEKGSFGPVFSVMIMFGIVQLIDNLVVQPLVVGKSVNLHPLIVMIAVLIGGKIGGILGMLLAVPVTTIGLVFIQEIYDEIHFWTNYNKKLNNPKT
jgi:putative permease